MSAKDTIFVQIPAYRDRELAPTVCDLFERARRPDRLRVAVAWQYAEDERHVEAALRPWKTLELWKIPAQQSLGCNWARRLLQSQSRGERYTLFLDSHHRFAPDWDEEAVAMLEGLRSSGIQKPILTGYLPAYDPANEPQGRSSCLLEVRSGDRVGDLLFYLVGKPVPDWTQLSAPIPARFVSLHFLFADGSLNDELAIDSSIYFFVDEIAVALRAYTLGYDLFHPHRIIGWHLYDRGTRVPHWEDHASWHEKDDVCRKRIRALFRGRLSGKYGVGSVRTVADYEALIAEPLIFGGGRTHANRV